MKVRKNLLNLLFACSVTLVAGGCAGGGEPGASEAGQTTNGSSSENSAGSGTNPTQDTGLNPNSDSGGGSSPGSGASGGAGGASGSGGETGSGDETGSGGGAGSGADSGSGGETGSGNETGSDGGADSGAESGSGGEAGSGDESGSGAAPGAEENAEEGQGAPAQPPEPPEAPQTNSGGLSGPDSLPIGEIPSIRLVSSVGGSQVPFTVGQVFREGDVPSSQTIGTALPAFQAVIRSRWPDGSAKAAVLSGHAALAANTALDLKLQKKPVLAQATPVSLNDLLVAAPQASVDFGSIGRVDLSNITTSPFKQTISGPQMSEWIFRQPVATDDHLVVWWRLRLYQTGALDVQVGVENGYLLKPNPVQKNYRVTIVINGTERYSADVEHFHHTRWAKFFWYDTDYGVIPAHDGRYLTDTRLFPNYGWRDPSENAIGGLPIPTEPFARGGYPTGMGAPGYSPSIGLLPLWDALYVTSGDSRAWRSMISHALAYGRYGVHFRDENTNQPVRLIDHGGLGVDSTTGIGAIGANVSYTPGSKQTGIPAYKMSHHPAPPYAAALLTGEWWFIEQCQFVSAANSLRSPGIRRGGERGIFQTGIANAARGAGWALRSLGMAATVTPDDEPIGAELRRQWSENMKWYADRYVRGSIDDGWFVNQFGILEDYNANNSSPGATGTAWWGGIWMQGFMQASIAFVWDMKIESNEADHKLVRDFLYKAVTGLMGDGSGANWDYRRGGIYSFPFSTVNSQNPPQYFSSWKAMLLEYERMYGLAPISSFGDTKLRRHGSTGNQELRSTDFITSYWANFQPGRAWAVDHGAPGAQAGYNRVISAENYGITPAQDLSDVPLWAIVPR